MGLLSNGIGGNDGRIKQLTPCSACQRCVAMVSAIFAASRTAGFCSIRLLDITGELNNFNDLSMLIHNGIVCRLSQIESP